MSTAVAPTRGVFNARVTENTPLCREHWRFTVEVDDFPQAAPGAFLQIQCSDPAGDLGSGATFIRRPFSIAGLRRNGNRCALDVIHRAVGPGTRWLSKLQPGDAVSILGPLGQAFPIRNDLSNVYMVGGGVGLPPLIWLAEALHAAGQSPIAFVGSRSSDLVPLTRVDGLDVNGLDGSLAYEEFARSAVPTVLSTDDGSLGAAGRIPDVFAAYLDRHKPTAADTIVYTCGPELMMKAVANACAVRSITCMVCLERVMACGMGTCQSCVVGVRDPAATNGWRYRLCCTDGPVFDSKIVIWE